MDKEQWLPIPGFPGYEVSDLGRVRGIERLSIAGRTLKAKMLAATPNRGYPRVALRREGKTFYRDVHRLVARAFLGPCPDGQEVRHIFGDSTSAALTGLEYGTRAQNIADCKRHGGFRNGADHLTETLVREIAARDEPARVLAEIYRVSIPTIGAIRNRHVWAHLKDLYINPNRRQRPTIPDEIARQVAGTTGTCAEIGARFGISAGSVSNIRRYSNKR